MKKSYLFYIGSLIIVSLLFLNFAFNGVNQIVLGKLGVGGNVSAFNEMSGKSFSFNVPLYEVDDFVDEVINQANINKVLVLSYIQPSDSDTTDVYLYGNGKFNPLLEYYLPYKSSSKINFQDDFVIDYDLNNSSMHKNFFILDHNISIKSYSQLKSDDLEFFWNMIVFGNQKDIETFKSSVNAHYNKQILENYDSEGVDYNIYNYIIDANKDSTFLLIVAFLMMFYFAINLIKHQTDEISVRKLMGQNDSFIASVIIKRISTISLLTVVGVILFINVFYIRSLNYVLVMMVVMELLLMITICALLLICWLYIYNFTKNTSVVQIVKINKNFIKGFNAYQILKVVILLIVFSNYSSTINYGLNALQKLYKINSSYSTLSKVSYFNGFKGASSDQPITQALFTELMDEYYFNHSSEEIYAIRSSILFEDDVMIPVISMDLKTAQYYAIDCDDYCVFINSNVYQENSDLINRKYATYSIIEEDIRKASLLSLNEVEYVNPIIEINNVNNNYNYYVLEDVVGSNEKYLSIIQDFDDERIYDIRVNTQKKLVDQYKNRIQKSVDTLMLESMLLFAIIILMAISLVELYYSAYKTKLDVKYILGKSNVNISMKIILTEIIIYFIVWLILYIMYGSNTITNFIVLFGLIISCFINVYLLIKMIKKELTRVL